jgi:hypothetical protein
MSIDRLRTFIIKPKAMAKNKQQPLIYKDILWHKKRPNIESVMSHLDLNLSSQRSPINGFATIFANLFVYTFYPDKPEAAIKTIYQLKQPENQCAMAA